MGITFEQADKAIQKLRLTLRTKTYDEYRAKNAASRLEYLIEKGFTTLQPEETLKDYVIGVGLVKPLPPELHLGDYCDGVRIVYYITQRPQLAQKNDGSEPSFRKY